MISAKLKELVAKATDGPHVVDDANFELVAIDGDAYKYVSSFDPRAFSDTELTGEEIAANAKLYCYLRNHAQDFIRLMEAAEQIKANAGRPEIVYTLAKEALAAFEEKS
jgi:hypothetical protein